MQAEQPPDWPTTKSASPDGNTRESTEARRSRLPAIPTQLRRAIPARHALSAERRAAALAAETGPAQPSAARNRKTDLPTKQWPLPPQRKAGSLLRTTRLYRNKEE